MKQRLNKFNLKFKELAQKAGITVDPEILEFCVSSNNKNDHAHNLEHVYGVVKLGVELGIMNGYYGTKEMLIIYYGCLMHDLGCRWDREAHHVESAILAEELLSIFGKDSLTDDDIQQVKIACLEHRSSYAGGPTTPLSTIVALADRGRPNFPLYVMRAFIFREEDGLTQAQMVNEVHAHLLDKFSRSTGYNWKSYPKEGLEFFKEEWAEFDRLLLRKNVRSLVNTYADQYISTGKVRPVDEIDTLYTGSFGRVNDRRKIVYVPK
ncbi:putative metal-dependent phosphohydrolase [Vibrio phage phiKT1028]|nr:putative metal-dependent phosphohydrolase [Vibrio phage phiKT1028]